MWWRYALLINQRYSTSFRSFKTKPPGLPHLLQRRNELAKRMLGGVAIREKAGRTMLHYPRPPFPNQHQPMPGKTAAMIPVPDHGETSYKGSGRLNGKKAVITGGDSGIGRAVAIA
jgi:hypothetical protein